MTGNPRNQMSVAEMASTNIGIHDYFDLPATGSVGVAEPLGNCNLYPPTDELNQCTVTLTVAVDLPYWLVP